MEKLVRFYFGQDLIWSQVGSSQRQSSSVNHHPSGCWHSERPGSNLCRSADLSTHHSTTTTPTKVSVPTGPSRVSRPCQKSISTSSPGLRPVAFAPLSTRLNITRLLLRHSAVTWQNPLSKAIYSSLFTAELSIKRRCELVQDCLLCSCWSLCCNHMLSTVRSNSWHLLSTELRAKVSSFCV